MIQKIFYWIFYILYLIYFASLAIGLFLAIISIFTIGLSKEEMISLLNIFFITVIFYYITSKLKSEVKKNY